MYYLIKDTPDIEIMATPQSFFGGTSKKVQPDNSLNQVGHKSAGTHNTTNQLRGKGAASAPTGSPRNSSAGKGNNAQQVRHRSVN